MATSTSVGERPLHVRYGLRVRGAVQDVGFRPAVQRLAAELGLAGLVRRDGEGVWIEIEGDLPAIDRFAHAVDALAQPLTYARIDAVAVEPLQPLGEDVFRIVPTRRRGYVDVRARLPADSAPCAECARELADPADRRHRYPFIDCTACGPRYTIAVERPWERARTTMAAFVPCADCRREYDDPADRRFRAEASGCPACGPRLQLRGSDGTVRAGDALALAASALRSGQIVALKGAGGFQLLVDARDEAAVARLRARKQRSHQPLALLARDLDEAARVVRIGDEARRALLDPARPIVLLPARPDGALAPSVAPGLHELGVLLPPTPLHELVLAEGPPLVAITSANRRDEPILDEDDDAAARAQLGALAHLVLTHDRSIHTRLEDSIVRIVAGAPLPLQRARGYVPEAIALPVAGVPVLAVGGQQRSTVCLTRGEEAFVSQPLGDLGQPASYALFDKTVAQLERLVGVTPARVAHDLDPEDPATQWARACGRPALGVQHHHAHVAACLAEHGRVRAAIGVAFDGSGCGPDGERWGGEFLVADLGNYRRAGHLRPLVLAGGDAATRQPWRLALAALVDAGLTPARLGHIDLPRLAAVARLLLTELAGPRATSAGRWIDAVAALVGLRDEVGYDGQAALELEAQATLLGIEPYAFAVADTEPFVVDLRPTVRAIVAALDGGERTAVVASRFYETLARVVVAGAIRVRAQVGLETVALSGSCFGGARLTERARALLARAGFEVLLHRRVPPNDGGLSFGQAAIASFHAWRETHHGPGRLRPERPERAER